jgi:hypothetical protein
MGGMFNMDLKVFDLKRSKAYGSPVMGIRDLSDRIRTKLSARKRESKKLLFNLGKEMVEHGREMVRREGWYQTASLHNSIRLMKRANSETVYEWAIGGVLPTGRPPGLAFPRGLGYKEPADAKGPKKFVSYALIHELGLFNYPVTDPKKTPQGVERPVIRSTADLARMRLMSMVSALKRKGVPIYSHGEE